MGAFIVAGVALAVGLLGLLLWILAASQMTAPSVQDSGWGPGWFLFWLVVAALITASHWLPPIGW